jgi:hypothetical protein
MSGEGCEKVEKSWAEKATEALKEYEATETEESERKAVPGPQPADMLSAALPQDTRPKPLKQGARLPFFGASPSLPTNRHTPAPRNGIRRGLGRPPRPPPPLPPLYRHTPVAPQGFRRLRSWLCLEGNAARLPATGGARFELGPARGGGDSTSFSVFDSL